MKLGLIGFGQAGGKVVDKLLAYETSVNRSFIGGAIAINTARSDLHGLQNIRQENRILIGQARVKGHGVGADNEPVDGLRANRLRPSA